MTASLSGFVRSSYSARVVGLGAGFFTVGGVLHENGASWWLWLWLAGHGFVWPHIAHLWIRSSHDPDATENLNRLIDHFSSGVWIAAIQFNFMPAAIMFTLLSMNNMIAGGWRACLRGMLCHLTGIGVGVLMFGARWQPHSSMPVMLACIPVLLLNPFMVGQTTWRALVKLRRQRAELKRLSLMDSLTGLANRRKFFADVEALCVHQEPGDATQPQRFALGVLDLDGFKSVNDLHGHAAGDQLLEQVAQRLQSLCGDGVSIARLGGDEFAFAFTGHQDDMHLLASGARFCSALRAPFDLSEGQVRVSASMGIATYPEMASSAPSLYICADYALYQAKHTNRGAVIVFSAEHRGLMQRDAAIEQALRRIDFGQEMQVYFQPIIDIRDGRTIAFEALARWNSPTLGQMEPKHFIPVAERMGLIRPLTLALLRKALTALVRWPVGVRLSFNLSANDVSTRAHVARIVELLHDSGIDPRRVDFEITETMIMNDIRQTHSAIEQLAIVGCGVTLDDFGTGYSSLTQLHALPLTKIKIDRSFVTGLENDPVSRKIVKSLLALSRDMEIGCVIEGVETKDEEGELVQLGGVLMQGYLYSRPLQDSQVLAWLGR